MEAAAEHIDFLMKAQLNLSRRSHHSVRTRIRVQTTSVSIGSRSRQGNNSIQAGERRYRNNLYT